jgi:hypothetical protein
VKHTVKMAGVIVGHSELEMADPDLGRAWGAFRPGLGYDLVQPVFRLFAQAVPRHGSRDDELLQRYYRSRDALKLELTDGDGRRIPTTAIHIADYSVEEGPSAIELDVLIADESYWSTRLG